MREGKIAILSSKDLEAGLSILGCLGTCDFLIACATQVVDPDVLSITFWLAWFILFDMGDMHGTYK